MIITWTKRVDVSRHISFQFGNVVRANGRDYCVVTCDATDMTLWPANDEKEPIKSAAVVSLRWHEIIELHIY